MSILFGTNLRTWNFHGFFGATATTTTMAAVSRSVVVCSVDNLQAGQAGLANSVVVNLC